MPKVTHLSIDDTKRRLAKVKREWKKLTGESWKEPARVVIGETELRTAFQRAVELIDWMVAYVGKMAPEDYSDCYADLNEHGLFCDRNGFKPLKKKRAVRNTDPNKHLCGAKKRRAARQ